MHLASFNWNPSLLDCRERSSTTHWRLLSQTFPTVSEIEVSSTYFHMSAGVSRSLILIKNSHGPNLVPWGMPAETECHSEWQSCVSFTRFFQSMRKSTIQHKIRLGISYEDNFRTKTLWSIKSKAFLKSHNTTLAVAPFRSVPPYQLWVMLINVGDWVEHGESVDVFLLAPL